MPAPQPADPAELLIGAPAKEAVCLWGCALDAWTDYLAALVTAPGPAAVVEANAQLMLDSFEVCSRAAGVRLADSGLRAPLLADA